LTFLGDQGEAGLGVQGQELYLMKNNIYLKITELKITPAGETAVVMNSCWRKQFM
jgi:hypothetical protein